MGIIRPKKFFFLIKKLPLRIKMVITFKLTVKITSDFDTLRKINQKIQKICKQTSNLIRSYVILRFLDYVK